MASAAGRIVRSEDQIWFISEDVIEQVVPRAVVSPIPGSPLLMTLVDGDVLPVLPLGRLDLPLLVCVVATERIALAGLQVAATGNFERRGDGAHVVFEERSVSQLDLTSPLDLLTPSTRNPPSSGSEVT
jgi:hypothetical protein